MNNVSKIKNNDDGMSKEVENSSRKELDSHANMVVVGCNVIIIIYTVRTTEVKLFTP